MVTLLQASKMYQYQSIMPLMAPLFNEGPIVNDCDLFINSIVSGGVGPVGPPGPVGPQGPPGNPGLVPVTIVSTTPFTANTSQYFLAVDVATAASVVLPTSVTGTVFIVKDIDGDAATNPITITATGGVLIDGLNSATIDTPFGALEFIFNGTAWSIV